MIHFKYEEYNQSKKAADHTLDAHFAIGNKYTSTHPQQKAINASYVQDLVVGCSLPLGLCENPRFQRYNKQIS